MLYFGRCLMPELFEKPSAEIHREFADICTDDSIRKAVLIAPRGTAKSSIIAGVKPLHHVFIDSRDAPHQQPGKQVVLLVSKTLDHAKALLGSLKGTLESRECVALFGDWGEKTAKKWTTDEVVLKNGTVLLAKGAGQQIRGLKRGWLRPTLVVVDDPEDEKNTRTDDSMDLNMNQLLKGIVPALHAGRGKLVVVGTPVHYRCMVEKLYGVSGWFSRRYRLVDEERKTTLWPEVFSYEDMMAEKRTAIELGKVSSWYSERQCIVVGDSDQLFKKEDMRWWDGHLKRDGFDTILVIEYLNFKRLDTPKEVRVNVFTGVDPAASTSQRADYSVIFNLAYGEDDNWYCLSYIRDRFAPHDLAEEIIDNYNVIKAKKTRIESNLFRDLLREYINRLRGVRIPGTEIKEVVSKSKEKRYLESLQPKLASHKWHLRSMKDREGMQTYVEEMLTFPRGEHDDILDAAYMASKGNYPPPPVQKKKASQRIDRDAFITA